MPWEHAICLGGENVQVTDCDVFSSRSPFGFKGLRHSVVRNNRFFEGDVSHIIDGEGIIFEDNQIEGGPTGRGGADYANQLYFARNEVGMTPLADGEGFTTDGGGNAPVKLAACDGRHLTLAADVDWNRWTHNGACAAGSASWRAQGRASPGGLHPTKAARWNWNSHGFCHPTLRQCCT